MYPRLLQYGPVTLPAYGAFAALALVAALLLAMRTARTLGLNPDHLWNLGLTTAFSALISAKLLLALENWHSFLDHPIWILSLSITRTRHLALAAVVCGSLAAIFYLRRHHMPLLLTLDAAAPALALGTAILSLGAFAAGSEYGLPTNLPWAVVFRDRYAAFSAGTPLGIPLHPTQLYQSIASLILCCILLWLIPRRTQSGEAIGTFLFFSGISFFLIQMFRGDAQPVQILIASAFTVTQIISLCMIAIGGLFWLPRSKQSPQQSPAASHAS